MRSSSNGSGVGCNGGEGQGGCVFCWKVIELISKKWLKKAKKQYLYQTKNGQRYRYKSGKCE